MSVIDDLITNRTAEDGASYNAEDLNRVGEAQIYVRDRLATVGVDALDILGKQDWTTSDIPNQTEMLRYLADTYALRDEFSVDEPLPASMDRLTVEGANNIEKCLLALDEAVDRIKTVYLPSGSTFAVSGAPHLRICVRE